MTRNDVNRLVKVCLDIAEYIDKKTDQDKQYFGGEMCEEIGLGCRALTAYLRKGAVAVIDLQRDYHWAMERKNASEMSEKICRDFLEDVFGDKEIDTINDSDKERIKEFVRGIMKEWEDEWEKEEKCSKLN